MLEMYSKPYVKGFTTNPTLMRKAGIKPTVTKVRPDSPLLQEIAPGQRLKKSASEVKAMLDVPEPAKTPGGRPNSRNPRSATPSASGRPKRGGPSSGRRGSGSGASSGSRQGSSRSAGRQGGRAR